MSIYKTKVFQRFAKKHDISDDDLCSAGNAVADGESDADLGGGVFKQRVARVGGGKSGGYRTIVLYKLQGHIFFVYGFAKNERGNIDDRELAAFKKLAKTYAEWPANKLMEAVAAGELLEVKCDVEDQQEGSS